MGGAFSRRRTSEGRLGSYGRRHPAGGRIRRRAARPCTGGRFEAGRQGSHRCDLQDAHRLCDHRRPGRRFDQPRRARGPARIPHREDGAGARSAGRRRHRQGRALLLPADLLADRRQCADAQPGRDRAGRRLHAAGRHGAVRHARPVLGWLRSERLGEPGDAAAARHIVDAQRAAAGAGAARPRADQGLLHHERLSGPLFGQPAVGGGIARTPRAAPTVRCAPATASRRS